jgi:endonuclease V-like protein UPF0215 family
MSIRIISNADPTSNDNNTVRTYDNCSNIRLEKKGIRVLGIAESFRKCNNKSTLAGIVMRRDLIIDGIVFGTTTLRGTDSTENILHMFNSLKRNDVNCIILDGLIISMYNIIDGGLIQNETEIPVIAITFEDSRGLEANIRYHFPHDFELRLERYVKLGKRDQVILKTGRSLFIRMWGLPLKSATAILNSFTLQGSIPEPIRVAKLAARAQRKNGNCNNN